MTSSEKTGNACRTFPELLAKGRGKEKEEKATKKEREKKRRRKEEKGTTQGSVKRRFVSSDSVQAFDIFDQGRDLETCGDLSWEDLVEEPEPKAFSPKSVPTLVQLRRKR